MGLSGAFGSAGDPAGAFDDTPGPRTGSSGAFRIAASSAAVIAGPPGLDGRPSAAMIAAPMIPASLRSWAGTTRHGTVRRGTNLSALLLTPPPRIIRFGHISCWIRSRCSSRSAAQAFHDSPRRTRAAAAERRSAARPRISICPNSVFGTRVPSMKTPEPTPVPRVRKMTTPGSSLPTPNRISAIPAASASLMMNIGRLSVRVSRSTTGKSIHAWSMLPANLSTPPMVTPGRPIPTGVVSASPPDLASRRTSRAIDAMTASGVDGTGVATRSRSERRRPASMSTTAALIPLPPTSTPMATRPPAASEGSCVIDASGFGSGLAQK